MFIFLHTIFINWSIIIIAGCDEGTSSCTPKISSSMVLQCVSKDERYISESILWRGLRSLRWKGNLVKSNHVIIDKWTTLLYKACHSECQVFNWSVMDRAPKFRKPIVVTERGKILHSSDIYVAMIQLYV